MDEVFDTHVAPLLLGGGAGLVLIHALGIQAVHPLLLIASVPVVAVGACGMARHYLRRWGLLSWPEPPRQPAIDTRRGPVESGPFSTTA